MTKQPINKCIEVKAKTKQAGNNTNQAFFVLKPRSFQVFVKADLLGTVVANFPLCDFDFTSNDMHLMTDYC
jgi:hypothetical protein